MILRERTLLEEFDAVCLTIGAMKPRDLQVEGRELNGIHFAMDFLTQQNKANRGMHIDESERITQQAKRWL